MGTRRRNYLRYAVRVAPRAELQLAEVPTSAVRQLQRQLQRIAGSAPGQEVGPQHELAAEGCSLLCEVDHELGRVVVLDVSREES